MSIQDKFDIVVKSVAVLGGLIAAFRVIYELRQNTRQRQQELRWRQANSAKELINRLEESQLASDAMIMFDWTGREFEIAPKVFEAISFHDVKKALRITNTVFSDKETYIRDCTDAFLFEMEFMEQAIRNDLTQFKDLIFPMKYCIDSMKQHDIYDSFVEFVKEYGYTGSYSFVQRLTTNG